jgi:hypothetical protein
MGLLRNWWGRPKGRRAGPTPSSRRAPPESGPGRAAGGLELADDRPAGQPARAGRAGFDPYASDAGYAKPHTWERVDHD